MMSKTQAGNWLIYFSHNRKNIPPTCTYNVIFGYTIKKYIFGTLILKSTCFNILRQYGSHETISLLIMTWVWFEFQKWDLA